MLHYSIKIMAEKIFCIRKPMAYIIVNGRTIVLYLQSKINWLLKFCHNQQIRIFQKGRMYSEKHTKNTSYAKTQFKRAKVHRSRLSLVFFHPFPHEKHVITYKNGNDLLYRVRRNMTQLDFFIPFPQFAVHTSINIYGKP